MNLSQDTKDLIKLTTLAAIGVIVLVGVVTAHSHISAMDHATCIDTASKRGIDDASIILLCGKL